MQFSPLKLGNRPRDEQETASRSRSGRSCRKASRAATSRHRSESVQSPENWKDEAEKGAKAALGNLSRRCRTQGALPTVEQTLLARLPESSREANVTLTTDNGTQFTSSRFPETLGRVGLRIGETAYHYPEATAVPNGSVAAWKRLQIDIARWIEEYNHERSSAQSDPARGLLGSRSCAKLRDPECLLLSESLRRPIQPSKHGLRAGGCGPRGRKNTGHRSARHFESLSLTR